jgi:hypothetical protein
VYTPVGTTRINELQVATDLESRSKKKKIETEKEYKEQGGMTGL